MNKLKYFRVILIVLIFFLIVLAAINFYKPPEIKIKDNVSAPVDASMVIEKGEHDIFSQEELIAHLSYSKAVQKEKSLEIKGVKVEFKKNAGKLYADEAIFRESTIYFKSKVRGFFPEKNMEIFIEPPSFFRRNLLVGKSDVLLKFPDYKLSGKKFFFEIEKSLAVFKDKSFFAAKNINIVSKFNTSYLNPSVELIFFKNAEFYNKKDKVKVVSDLIKNLPEKAVVFFEGKSVIFAPEFILAFNGGDLKRVNGKYLFNIKNGFNFKTNDLSGVGSNCRLMDNKIEIKYLKTGYENYVFSGVNNIFKISDKKLSGENPYIYFIDSYRKISGRVYNFANNELKIIDPFLKDEDILLVSSICVLKKNKEILFPESINGIFKQYSVEGTSARIIRNGAAYIYQGNIVSLRENNTIKGDLIELRSDKDLIIRKNVYAKILMQKSKYGEIFCNYMKINSNERKIYLNDKVSIVNKDFKAFPDKAIVFENFAILFNCNFNSADKYSGFAKIILINFNQRYSYLFWAEVKDGQGNTLKGDKLTLDNLTDRIFVEKTEKKSQVEVKIKI